MAFLTDMNKMKRLVVNTAAGGTVAHIAAIAGKTICIYGMDLSLASATTLSFLSAATVLTGLMTGTGKSLGFLTWGDGIYPRYVCAVGEAFNIAYGGAVQCSGVIYYTQE